MSRTPETIVINTGPLLALIAAWGGLQPLQPLYRRILVPWEVGEEIRRGGATGFGIAEFEAADFLRCRAEPVAIEPFLRNSLDQGEAAVIQLALNECVDTVCIDEAAGRRIARLHELKLTGSVGVLVRAKQAGQHFSMHDAVARMQAQGIRLSEAVIEFALSHE
jgi:predicted nucleic acid-binding protein